MPTPPSEDSVSAGGQSSSLKTLRLIAEHLKRIDFPRLTRPRIHVNEPPTVELVNWGIQTYCLPWIRHFGVLISGIVTLTDSNNKPAVRIVGRSSYELCAHIYYVQKHLDQHLRRKDLAAAWEFLAPIQTGSRYLHDLFPQDSASFPAPAHISKAINCFKEIVPEEFSDDYSYLSEYTHPNTMAFQQHYRWIDPDTIEFADMVPFGAFGVIAASAIQGLLAADKLLTLCQESRIQGAIRALLHALVAQGENGGLS